MTVSFAHLRKFVTALIGAATLAIALKADGQWTAEDFLAIGTSFATALGVYVVPNDA